MSDAPASDRGARRAARAIDALRRGWPFRIEGADGALDLLAVESARDTALTEFGSADLLISGERAVTLKLTNQRAAATPGPVRLADGAASIAAALAIADPALDLANPLKGPFRTIASGGEAAAATAMTMARHAGLLPAFFVRAAEGEAETVCSTADVAALLDPARLEIAARAHLPVAASETAEIVAFRSPEEASDHVALIIGKRDGNPPVVRLHSECLTGDVLGSLKCDCGPQLHAALHAMADAPWGCCSICARKAAASASSTSCAPMRCRIRAMIRSMPICGWVSPWRRAILRSPARCSRCSTSRASA